MADGCDYLAGQAIAIDGGGHLGNGGNYAHLTSRTESGANRADGENRLRSG